MRRARQQLHNEELNAGQNGNDVEEDLNNDNIVIDMDIPGVPIRLAEGGLDNMFIIKFLVKLIIVLSECL